MSQYPLRDEISYAWELSVECDKMIESLHREGAQKPDEYRDALRGLALKCQSSLITLGHSLGLKALFSVTGKPKWVEQLFSFALLQSSNDYFTLLEEMTSADLETEQIKEVRKQMQPLLYLCEVVSVMDQNDLPLPIRNGVFVHLQLYNTLHLSDHENIADMLWQGVCQNRLSQEESISAYESLRESKDFSLVETHLACRLKTAPLAPLGKLRKHVLGSAAVSTGECSTRLSQLFSAVCNGNVSQDQLDETLAAIAVNGSYRKHCLTEDVILNLDKQIDERRNSDAMIVDYGKALSLAFTDIFKRLRLTDAQLSSIALRCLHFKNIGEAFEAVDRDPLVGSLLISNSLGFYSFNAYDSIFSDVRRCLQKSVLFAMSEHAQQVAIGRSDRVKLLYYGLTQDPRFLEGAGEASLASVAEIELGL